MVANLRKLRCAQGMSQQQLAQVLGVSQQSINKYENHSVEPDFALLMRMADFFHTSVDFLIGYAEEDAPNPQSWKLEEEEQALVRSFRLLSAREQESIRLVIQNYLAARGERCIK